MNMKKFVAFALVVVCIVIAAVSLSSGNRVERMEELEEQASVQDTLRVEGLIVSVGEGHFIMQEKDLGEIQVNFDAMSMFEGVSAQELSFGQYVFIDFDGKMTRSLPPQIFAQKVGMYPVAGVVVEIGEGSITIEQENGAGQAIIHLAEGAFVPEMGEAIIAYTNGAMTMSLPPQTTALAIDVVTAEN